MGRLRFRWSPSDLGRASRGLTAIPVHAADGPEPRRLTPRRSAGRRKGGFLLCQEWRAARGPSQGKKPERPAEGPPAAW
ncbi:hypothetical protein EFQ99_30700 [Rhizobium vallis]|uniref:Uncharacterized protein n=1 Tax=Rhizobium vallis TaxID=634290 RepID=A0A432PC27_9HYPH|nr:hypothetical protein EFQ99_30700 [Rhizobium vallis]